MEIVVIQTHAQKEKKKRGGKKKKKDSPRANTTGEIVTLMLAQGKKSH